MPVSTLTNSNFGGVVNNTAAVSASIEYKKVVLQLEVVPLINSEKEVSLDILAKDRQHCPGWQRKHQRQLGPDNRYALHTHECCRTERIDDRPRWTN